MKLTKQQKGVIGIFCLALIALACDRLFLLPKGANAGSRGAALPQAQLVLTGDSLSQESTPGSGLGERLHALIPDDALDFNGIRDAFSRSNNWQGNGASNGPSQTEAITVFKQTYQLRAIIYRDDLKAVFINDEQVRIGDRLGGFELIALDELSATFANDDGQIVLRLDG